ncbi:hypothetical protein DLM78_03710 [Leptospira stimsonii]|uniref:Uncharacterized protein n=1 Tax=Leptospira stimsonii TaxID=2202203 RepID=A0A8B3CUY6_9LEPT|nr:hypothetical protein DLM78_03710 [Leptospira stimsonii]
MHFKNPILANRSFKNSANQDLYHPCLIEMKKGIAITVPALFPFGIDIRFLLLAGSKDRFSIHRLILSSELSFRIFNQRISISDL